MKEASLNSDLEFEGITFEVRRRRVKYARIEYTASGITLIVPGHVQPLSVLKQNKQSILKKCARLKERIAGASRLSLIERTEAEFRQLVSGYLETYTRQLKVQYREIRYRKMKRRWGSCRSNGVITLNRYLAFLPERLIAYIVFHELLHLNIRGHNSRFKAGMLAEFPDGRAIDKELILYGLKLLS